MDKNAAAEEWSENNENEMRDVITVECQKINGKQFIGTVNFSEAKIKIFEDGLGLNAGLLGPVKITFNNSRSLYITIQSIIIPMTW